jgi:hypothetical protein
MRPFWKYDGEKDQFMSERSCLAPLFADTSMLGRHRPGNEIVKVEVFEVTEEQSSVTRDHIHTGDYWVDPGLREPG